MEWGSGSGVQYIPFIEYEEDRDDVLYCAVT